MAQASDHHRAQQCAAHRGDYEFGRHGFERHGLGRLEEKRSAFGIRPFVMY
ncbi:hypothetical protein [Methyloferula stellata]|uniref:hypothetical protein n=1 Tax=Methyloferula stellata TaxID=876270 RepID=UPI00037968BF|nr:hypothetical protein [Methyloferula stellata]